MCACEAAESLLHAAAGQAALLMRVSGVLRLVAAVVAWLCVCVPAYSMVVQLWLRWLIRVPNRALLQIMLPRHALSLLCCLCLPLHVSSCTAALQIALLALLQWAGDATFALREATKILLGLLDARRAPRDL